MRLYLIAAGILIASALQAQQRYAIRLSTMPVEVTTRDQVTGSGRGEAVLAGERLTIRARFRALNVDTGETLWETRLATSAQGFPLTFRVDGKQFVAVTTGLGGGSPRVVPSLIAPEIRHPATGKALYVFELAD